MCVVVEYLLLLLIVNCLSSSRFNCNRFSLLLFCCSECVSVVTVCLPVAPLVARLDAIELTDPLLIDTDDCWLWLRAEDGLGRVCWLPKWTSAVGCPPP